MRQASGFGEVFMTDLNTNPNQVPPWGYSGLVDLIERRLQPTLRRYNPNGNGADFSVIIPTRKNSPRIEALESVLNSRIPDGASVECILAVGNHPSIQRNRAISMAKGKLVGFLDDDCIVQRDWLVRSPVVMSSHSANIVGGPNLTPKDSSFFAKCVGMVLSSRLGTAMMRARYKPVGDRPQDSADHKTALCNMVFEREIFEKFQFNEDIFPNEENELLNRVMNDGYKTVYDPGLAVEHPRKNGSRSFAKQILAYGAGRAHQTRIQPRTLRPIHIIPSLTLLGAITFIASIASGPGWLTTFLGAGLLFYMLLVLTSSSIIASSIGKFKALPVSALLFPLLHFSYGLGFLIGLLSNHKMLDSKDQRIWLLRLTISNTATEAPTKINHCQDPAAS